MSASTGLKVVLGVEVPELVEKHLGDDVRGLLADHGLTIEDVDVWVSHPGGPKVHRGDRVELGLPRRPARPDLAVAGARSATYRPHRCCTSCATHCERGTRAPGSWGMLMAMGPGFCSELVLLRW